ncbi:hypothetical protein [Patulibacter minatonensis]|uniref:hypothetical protein n=1 Tax=Patulibacter minatonensis TaxID=298163 RepID=UPI001B7FB88C|nr:hypothetical protein [Patulibacter minatonensis]
MIPRSRAFKLALPVLAAAALAVSSTADASSVVYVQGNEVWQSQLDGSNKRRLSAGEGDWRQVAASDSGRIIGIRLEAGKISQLTNYAIWEPSGAVYKQGALGHDPTGSLAMPLSLDLTANGELAVYGFSNLTGLFPNQNLETGTYASPAANTSGAQPLKIPGRTWPTMGPGDKIVAATGQQVWVQGADIMTFNPWPGLDLSANTLAPGIVGDLTRTDVAADGKSILIDLQKYNGGEKTHARVAYVRVAGLGGAVDPANDCFLPSAGLASDGSLSADGSSVAWADSEGVKVAGKPSGNGDVCAVASPPVLLAAGAKFPSISPVDVPVTPVPGGGGGGGGTGGTGGGGTGGGGTGGGGGGGGSTTTPKITAKLPGKVTAKALSKGVTLTVTAPATGRVSLTGKVPGKKAGKKKNTPTTVATGSATAKKAGAVKVKLRLVASQRKRASKLRGATLSVKVTQGKATSTVKVKLK